jgi:hypothetical protein
MYPQIIKVIGHKMIASLKVKKNTTFATNFMIQPITQSHFNEQAHQQELWAHAQYR